jgi:ketosteroid isomerase-like protein
VPVAAPVLRAAIELRERRGPVITQSQSTQTNETIATIERFNEVFNRHDVDAVMALMTDDVIFENTSPSPAGERFQGQEAVRGFWESFFGANPGATFDAEDIFAGGDRATVRWVYHWDPENDPDGFVRGVDVFRVRDGKVAEKLSYVKG